MLLPRDLPTSPPGRTETHPTLLVSWWCTCFSLAIILVRLAGRYIRTEKLFKEDKIMALAILPLCFRMGFVHVILLWGTNNVMTVGLTPEEIHHREIGSRLVLPSRILYALFLWIAKFTVSEFLKRLTTVVWRRSYEIGLQCIRWFLSLTFLAVVIATLAECHPFNHYWQVTPDPGAQCRQGYAQLITMGTADVMTDLLLVCFPLPIILMSSMATKRKVDLILLFALSLILVGITVYRVVAVIDHHADQQFRSLLASLEILAAAAVSNAIVLGSFIRDRGAKKQRYRFGSNAGTSSIERAQTPKRAITNRDWGSDADLVGSLGMRCAPELKEQQFSVPRPAPVALPTAAQAKKLTPAPIPGTEWTHRNRDSDCSDYTVDLEKSPEIIPPARDEPPLTPRGMSFFDVGGLLGDDRPPRPPPKSHQYNKPLPQISQQLQSSQDVTVSDALRTPSSFSHSSHWRPPVQPLHVPSSQRSMQNGGSNALLQDIGGLLSAPTHSNIQTHTRSAHSNRSHENKNEVSDLSDDNESINKTQTPHSTRLNPSSWSSSSSSPPSAPEARRDMSLVDVLRESPPPPQSGPSSRQAALQRMRRRDDMHGSDDDGSGGPGFQDVGGLLK